MLSHVSQEVWAHPAHGRTWSLDHASPPRLPAVLQARQRRCFKGSSFNREKQSADPEQQAQTVCVSLGPRELWDTLLKAWLREVRLQKEQVRCAAYHITHWPLGFWVFISYLPLSPGVRDRDCLLEAKYPHSRSFFGGWVGKELGRCWSHKTGGDVQPSHLELAANIISWNHVKWVSFSLKKIFPRPLKVRNSKKAIIRNQVFFTVNPFHQASWQYHSHEGLLWLG